MSRFSLPDGRVLDFDAAFTAPMTLTVPVYELDDQGLQRATDQTTEERVDVQFPQGWMRNATIAERAAVGATEVPDEPIVDTRTVEAILAQKITDVKVTAGNLILSYCPQYKQANLMARAVELALQFPGLRGDQFDEPYKTEWSAGQAIWDNIKAVRNHSNALEAEVTAITDRDTLLAWLPHDWPTF